MGSDGSWIVIWGPWSSEGVFRGLEAVLRWSWGVLIFLWGPRVQEVLMNPVGLEGSWGALRFHDKSWGFEGWRYFIKSSPWPQRTLQDLSEPFWSFRTLRTPRTPQDLLRILQSLGNLRTASRPLSTAQYSWNPSESFRNHQNTSGRFEPLGSHTTIC